MQLSNFADADELRVTRSVLLPSPQLGFEGRLVVSMRFPFPWKTHSRLSI